MVKGTRSLRVRNPSCAKGHEAFANLAGCFGCGDDLGTLCSHALKALPEIAGALAMWAGARHEALLLQFAFNCARLRHEVGR